MKEGGLRVRGKGDVMTETEFGVMQGCHPGDAHSLGNWGRRENRFPLESSEESQPH